MPYLIVTAFVVLIQELRILVLDGPRGEERFLFDATRGFNLRTGTRGSEAAEEGGERGKGEAACEIRVTMHMPAFQVSAALLTGLFLHPRAEDERPCEKHPRHAKDCHNDQNHLHVLLRSAVL